MYTLNFFLLWASLSAIMIYYNVPLVGQMLIQAVVFFMLLNEIYDCYKRFGKKV